MYLSQFKGKQSYRNGCKTIPKYFIISIEDLRTKGVNRSIGRHKGGVFAYLKLYCFH